jgi:hypothetical protein
MAASNRRRSRTFECARGTCRVAFSVNGQFAFNDSDKRVLYPVKLEDVLTAVGGDPLVGALQTGVGIFQPLLHAHPSLVLNGESNSSCTY